MTGFDDITTGSQQQSAFFDEAVLGDTRYSAAESIGRRPAQEDAMGLVRLKIENPGNYFSHHYQQMIAANEGQESGTTAAMYYFDPEKKEITTANLGDSRVYITIKNPDAAAGSQYKTILLTEDHNPNLPRIKDEVKSKGGFVVYYGGWRVNGDLAVGAAIGDKDFPLKTEPDVVTFDIDELCKIAFPAQDPANFEFVVTNACDGLTDHRRDQNADFVVERDDGDWKCNAADGVHEESLSNLIARHQSGDKEKSLAHFLKDDAYEFSGDNISVSTLSFKYGEMSEQAIAPTLGMVFDGHGGSETSQSCIDYIKQNYRQLANDGARAEGLGSSVVSGGDAAPASDVELFETMVNYSKTAVCHELDPKFLGDFKRIETLCQQYVQGLADGVTIASVTSQLKEVCAISTGATIDKKDGRLMIKLAGRQEPLSQYMARSIREKIFQNIRNNTKRSDSYLLELSTSQQDLIDNASINDVANYYIYCEDEFPDYRQDFNLTEALSRRIEEDKQYELNRLISGIKIDQALVTSGVDEEKNAQYYKELGGYWYEDEDIKRSTRKRIEVFMRDHLGADGENAEVFVAGSGFRRLSLAGDQIEVADFDTGTFQELLEEREVLFKINGKNKFFSSQAFQLNDKAKIANELRLVLADITFDRDILTRGIQILLPFSHGGNHWSRGELNLKIVNETLQVDITDHNPLGHNKVFGEEEFKIMSSVLIDKLQSAGLAVTSIAFNNKRSTLTPGRQTDANSCGPITAHEIACGIFDNQVLGEDKALEEIDHYDNFDWKLKSFDAANGVITTEGLVAADRVDEKVNIIRIIKDLVSRNRGFYEHILTPIDVPASSPEFKASLDERFLAFRGTLLMKELEVRYSDDVIKEALGDYLKEIEASLARSSQAEQSSENTKAILEVWGGLSDVARGIAIEDYLKALSSAEEHREVNKVFRGLFSNLYSGSGEVINNAYEDMKTFMNSIVESRSLSEMGADGSGSTDQDLELALANSLETAQAEAEVVLAQEIADAKAQEKAAAKDEWTLTTGFNKPAELTELEQFLQKTSSNEQSSSNELVGRLTAEIDKNKDNPNPRTPYRGTGIKSDLVQYGGNQYALQIADIFPPLGGRFSKKINENFEEIFGELQNLRDEGIVGGLITEVYDGDGYRSITDIVNESGTVDLALQQIAKIFHDPKSVKFKVKSAGGGEVAEGSVIEITCDNSRNSKSIFAPSASTTSGFKTMSSMSSEEKLEILNGLSTSRSAPPGKSPGNLHSVVAPLFRPERVAADLKKH